MDEIMKISLSEILSKKKDDNFNEFKQMMFNYKFDFDEQDVETGKTLLISLIEQQSPTEFIWFCLEYFADPNICDKQGNTALHYAFLSPNKQYIYILLLFNSDTKVKNNEGKEPHDLSSSLKKDDLNKIYEDINSVKLIFARLTRQRRDFAKEIFSFIEGGKDMKGVTSQKLAYFNMWLNDDSFSDSQVDANLFFEGCKFPTTSLEINYEEYVFGLSKIANDHGISKIDEYFSLYKHVLATGKKMNSEF